MRYFDTPWKICNEIWRWLIHPWAFVLFTVNNISWGQGWRFYGMPIIQKHRQSLMQFGSGLQLRSSLRSNPLGPNRPVILCTWQAGAKLRIGNNFAMTGGSICAAENITIGNDVTIGANSFIVDTDFHSLDYENRTKFSSNGQTAPIIIHDSVFIGMNSLVLKGVAIGVGSVVGAGSVVTKDVPEGVAVAGNPAQIIRELKLGCG